MKIELTHGQEVIVRESGKEWTGVIVSINDCLATVLDNDKDSFYYGDKFQRHVNLLTPKQEA